MAPSAFEPQLALCLALGVKLGITLAHQLDNRRARLFAHQVAGTDRQTRSLLLVAVARSVGRAHDQADGDLGRRRGRHALQGELTHHMVVTLVRGIRIGGMDLVEQARRMRIIGRQAQRQTRAAHGSRNVLGLGLQEVLTQVGVGACGALTVARALQHRERERCPLLLVLERAEQLGQVQAIVAVHGIQRTACIRAFRALT